MITRWLYKILSTNNINCKNNKSQSVIWSFYNLFVMKEDGGDKYHQKDTNHNNNNNM